MTDDFLGVCDMCDRQFPRTSLTSRSGFLALCPDCLTPPSAEPIDDFPGDKTLTLLDGLPEWTCPACGAVVRACMADRPAGTTPSV